MVNSVLSRIAAMADSAHHQLPNAAMIRAARALLAIDQSKLAVLVGVTMKTISLIENAADGGKIDGRRRKVVERIQHRLEDEFDIEFVFSNERTGYFGVLMRKAGYQAAGATSRRYRSQAP